LTLDGMALSSVQLRPPMLALAARGCIESHH
jgi:hypothetical protein